MPRASWTTPMLRVSHEHSHDRDAARGPALVPAAATAANGRPRAARARHRLRRHRHEPALRGEGDVQPEHGIPLTPANILGGVSAIFWALMIVVSLKYVMLIMRADNRGEGGIMALLALADGVGARPAAAGARPLLAARRVRRRALLRRRGADAGDLGAFRGRRPRGRHRARSSRTSCRSRSAC